MKSLTQTTVSACFIKLSACVLYRKDVYLRCVCYIRSVIPIIKKKLLLDDSVML